MEKHDIKYYETCRENIEKDLCYFTSDLNVKEWIKTSGIPLIKKNYEQILKNANEKMTEYAHATYLKLTKELNQIEEVLQINFSTSFDIEDKSIENVVTGGVAGALGAALIFGGPITWAVGIIGAVAGFILNSNRMEKELIAKILNNQNKVVCYYKEKCTSILSSIINVSIVNTYYQQEKIVEKTQYIDEKLTPEQEQIKKFLESRDIKYLIHFTDFKNVESIQKNGILSVQELQLRKIKFRRNDFNRFDNHLDYISLSISMPNDRLLGKYKIDSRIEKPVFFIIDSSILYKEINTHRIYCQTNAATQNGKSGGDFADLKNLFANKVVYSTRSGGNQVSERTFITPENIATDPQAEILFKKRIDPKYFISITDNIESIYKSTRYTEGKDLDDDLPF